MIEFIEGPLDSLSPTHAVINCNGVGYHISISLYTFERIRNQSPIRLLTHLSIKEDSHTLFGFFEESERMVFRSLIGVSGIGTATARMILSALDEKDLSAAIIQGNVALLKTIKGIGPKAAQRIVLELQDKFSKMAMGSKAAVSGVGNPGTEALEALLALGFARQGAEKVIAQLLREGGAGQGPETLIKQALKLL